ncbi:MAG TPA: calcium-binding protein [Rhizobiaceae bacterium]|nr:calcium-binding protein [Rhizobiaceae bacterium]
MAVVYLGARFEMSDIPQPWGFGSGGESIDATGQDVYQWAHLGAAQTIALIGNLSGEFFEPGEVSGRVKKILWDASLLAVPEIEVTLDMQMSTGVIDLVINGSLKSFFAEVLKGNDTIYGQNFDEELLGHAGNDILIGGDGADRLDGGLGIDTASYANAKAAVIVDWFGASSGDAAGDVFISINNLTGSRFNDRLYADDNANRVTGGLGNDILVGRFGADTLDGSTGIDTASYDASGGDVRVSLLNPAINTFEAKGDKYISIENLAGGGFDDHLTGNNAANRIEGNNFPNSVTVDHDKLFGLGGNDTLFGYRGNDILTGGLGKDTQTGGLGRDIFDFNSIAESVVGANRDFITDFTRGTNVTGDDIDLSTIDARTNVVGNQNFSWRGTLAFTGVSGQLRFTDQGTTCLVQGDVNGDGKADFEISVKVATLGVGDFIL